MLRISAIALIIPVLALTLLLLQAGDIAGIKAISGRARLRADTFSQFLAAETDPTPPCLRVNSCRSLHSIPADLHAAKTALHSGTQLRTQAAVGRHLLSDADDPLLDDAQSAAAVGVAVRRLLPGYPWMKRVKRVNGWPVYVPEEEEGAKDDGYEMKNNVFNAGGHAAYPHCQVEPLQILQAGLQSAHSVNGLNVEDMRRPLDWESFQKIMKDIQDKDIIVVEAAGLPCGWDHCCKGTVALRSQSTDVHVFEQIFVRHFLKDMVMAAPRNSSYILDAGGNGGYSTLLFAGLWPEAQVVVVEPDEHNLQVLEANVAGRPFSHNVRIVRGGLWGWDTNLTADPDAKGNHGEWGNVVRETDEGSGFPAYSVESLMARYNFPRLDIAKIDIEGAEAVVFAVHKHSVKVQEWLPKVNMLTLEIHPWFSWHYFKQDKLFEKLTTIIASPQYNGGTPFMLGFDNEHYIFKRVQFIGQKDEDQPAKWAPVKA